MAGTGPAYRLQFTLGMNSENCQTNRRSNPEQVSTLLAAAIAALLAGCGGAPSAEVAAQASGGAAADTNLLNAIGQDGVTVTVYINNSPTIAGIGGLQTFPTDAAGHLYVKAYLSVSATDQDGDDLDYEWSSPNCPAATITFPHHDDQSHVEFTAGPGTACKVQVKVTDLWKGGPPVGSNLPLEKGGEALGILELSKPPTITVGG
jgi:hypothetical protein